MSKLFKILFVVLVLLLVLLITLYLTGYAAPDDPDAQYFSNSIIMDGTYDFEHAMFSWNPALLPGYNLDFDQIQCAGAVRVNLNTFKCVEPYQWFYEPGDGKYYFTAHLQMGQLCGLSDVWLQPFLAVYNPTTGAHDDIYGATDHADYTWCSDAILPIIMNDAQKTGQQPYP